MPRTRDVEVWLGFEVRGAPALLTAPVHWAIFLVGAWGFWFQRPWILPSAAAYTFYVALSHLIWNEVSPNGHGWPAGIAEALAFSVLGVFLWRARHSRRAGCAGRLSRLQRNAANLVSTFRLLCAPALLVLAWDGASGTFLVLFGAGLLSDVLDGALARRLGQESAFGAQLDQWADFALWLSFPFGAWWLWPQIVLREAPYAVLAILCLLVPTAIAYAKYGAVPGYHTWSVKLGSVLMGIGVPLLLIFDLAWPFRVAALFQLVCAVDELGITYLFADCRHDVPSVFHAARLRRTMERVKERTA